MKLPQSFLDNMKLYLKDEFEDFVTSYNQPKVCGIRINLLKTDIKRFLEMSPYTLQKIPWVQEGYYIKEDESPGKHPYYHAGLYYIQEPSAMLPVEVLAPKPGDRVLDLCAAPGGKTVQIAAKLQGKGIVVSNDINLDRTKALVKNVEMSGIRNVVVLNESPQNLERNFQGYFDKILVDAPCSGEGMFRKDPDAVKSWANYKSEKCSIMQRDILNSAKTMLRSGGDLVYSTCTFTPFENECIISDFVRENPEFVIVQIPKHFGIQPGRPDWADDNPDLSKTARLWPHKVLGEGHFVALLKKKDTFDKNRLQDIDSNVINEVNHRQPVINIDQAIVEEFVAGNLNTGFGERIQMRGNKAVIHCIDSLMLQGLKVVKSGWFIGEVSKGFFTPSHSLALSIKASEFKRTLDLDSKSTEVLRYLKGETLIIEGEKGYTGVLVNGFPLGWGKQMGDMLKNLYPKGWRKLK